MKLFVGGSFQGKRDFVRERYGLAEEAFADGATIPLREAPAARALDHYHLLIGRQLAAGIDPEEALCGLLEEHPDILLLCDEVGGGVVPMDRSARDFREAVGRTMCLAARRAGEVWRICCGLGERIK